MITRLPPTWQPDEEPTFVFCESVFGIGPWHIRRLSDQGFKLGGGIDTPSLCDFVRPMGDFPDGKRGFGGWDLEVRITEAHLAPAAKGERRICCEKCANLYREATKKP